MNKNLVEWSKSLETFHLPRWDELPDLELYSIQVINLINNYLYILEEDNLITSAMINNYVKNKMMPKPINKKYHKIHLAYLIAITILKQVLTINQINSGVRYQEEHSSLKLAYNYLCVEVERCLNNVYKQVNGDVKNLDLNIPDKSQALNFAVNAFACKLVADKIVELNKLKENNYE